jgi:dsDNA-specific endonuclease/ATPase MutS2
MSKTGGTCFIEPRSVGRLQGELNALELESENEVRRILYTLTALIAENLPTLRRNIEAMETLDFLFAKGKLSQVMDAAPIAFHAQRSVRLNAARHPLLPKERAVPLDFDPGPGTRGVVITGPNTGGKTVALKTVGLLSLMAQSGLHVPAGEGSVLCLFGEVLCDIGDGQSISENLSSFSADMKNVI